MGPSNQPSSVSNIRKLTGSTSLTETPDLYQMAAEAKERQLLERLFSEIRRLTPDEDEREEMRPTFVEDPDELDLSEETRRHRIMEDYPAGGCHRLDAEMRTVDVDLLRDAQDVVWREGYHPQDDGWEFWLHAQHLGPLRDSVDSFARLEPDDGMGVDAVSIDGVPVRGFSLFPKGAILLWDPEEAITAHHKVGQREPAAWSITRPEYVCRVTSVGYDP